VRTRSILFFLITSMLLTSVIGQTRRKPPTNQQPTAAKPSRKLVEAVRTQDGREIHLYDDMTYDVAASTTSASATVSVTIKAGVITNSGDVKAVARRNFIIFKEDIKSILATVNDREGKPLDVFSFYLADQYRELDEGRAYNAALDKLKPITVGTVTTDFEGNATIQVPSGSTPYWVYGSTQRVGRSSCMWYIQVTPNKTASIVLDNNNATYCG